MIRRAILLIVYLVAGYVLGDLLAHLVLIPVAAIKHLNDVVVNRWAVAGGLLGVVIGFGNWRNRTAPGNSWGFMDQPIGRTSGRCALTRRV